MVCHWSPSTNHLSTTTRILSMPRGLKSVHERITIPPELSPNNTTDEITVVNVPVPVGYYAVVWGVSQLLPLLCHNNLNCRDL